MIIRYVGPGASCKGLWCRPHSAVACSLLRDTGYKLRSDLQIVAICTEIGDAWEQLSCEPWVAVASAGLEAA